MAALPSTIASILVVIGIGVIARLIGSRTKQLPYTIVLVVAGLLVSLLELPIGLPISHDVIFFLVLPPILFSGMLDQDYEGLRQNAPLIALLLIVGLPIAIILMGVVGQYVMAIPLIVALLLASMVYPLDPVAVLSIFEAMDPQTSY